MLPRDIERIMKKNEKYARMLEEFDRTGHLPFEKVRRSFTLERRTMERLMAMSQERQKSMSGIIDELVSSG